jgi:hypothetical protein
MLAAASVVSTATATATTAVFAFEARRSFVAGFSRGRGANFTGSFSGFARSFTASRRVIVLLMMAFMPFRFMMRWFHGHENFSRAFLHIRWILFETLVDGWLRFRLGFLHSSVVIGILSDGSSAIVCGFECSVTFLRIIWCASLEGLLHTIPDHSRFRARFNGEHTPMFQFHLLAA